MIGHPAFPVEEWTITETAFSPEILAQTETIFTVANGYLGLRGNLEEPAPVEHPGTYLNGFYESRPSVPGEAPPSSRVPVHETALSVTDGRVIALVVNGSPLDIRTGHLVRHRRVLDMAAAEVVRDMVWEAPSGGTLSLRTRRLASLVIPEVAAISYRVEALREPLELEIVSSLVANESTGVHNDDPREAAPFYGQVLLARHSSVLGGRLSAGYTTRASRLNVVTLADHDLVWEGQAEPEPFEPRPGEVGVSYRLTLPPGAAATLTKVLAYDWSASRSVDELLDGAAVILDGASALGYHGLASRQRAFASAFWERSDVTVEGDPELQQGMRFGLFQLLQAVANTGERGVAAKGLTGQGYDGHRFWDAEVFLVPILSHTTPAWASDLLGFRYKTLGSARERARQLGLKGALFPWRTISGADVTAYFPEGTAAYHLAADIAHAVSAYVEATGDEDFLVRRGAELLVETARLWMSLGHFDPGRGGAFCLDEVTGPDEYSALVDNNVYTNLMAAANLSQAAAAVRRLAARRPAEHAQLLEVSRIEAREVIEWERAARAVYVPYDAERGIHPQDDAFLHHAPFDLAAVPEGQRPLLLYYHPLMLYGRQVVKQADLVLALWLAADRFTLEEQRRDFAYYEPLTVHDSSLSAPAHAVVAARIGQLDTAMAYLRDAALVDLDNLADNVRDGVHLAGVAGSWLAVVFGLAGFRQRDGDVSFAPALPERLTRLRFPLAVGGRRIEVDIGPATTRYRLAEGDGLTLHHHDTEVALEAAGAEVRVPTVPGWAPGPTTRRLRRQP